MHNPKPHDDLDLKAIQKKFDKAVSIRQWSEAREKMVTYAMPFLAVGGIFSTSLSLNIWEHLPPQARMAGMMAFALGAVAAPFIKNKSGSPLTTKKEAIQLIDSKIGGPKDIPAHDFADTLEEGDNKHPLWEASKHQIWDKWGAQISAQKRQFGFENYYGADNKLRSATHISIACAAALSAALYADDLQKNWQTAMDWTVPTPPLVYTAQIDPPEGVRNLITIEDEAIKNALANGDMLAAYEQSILIIKAENREASIFINGSEEPIAPVVAEEGTNRADDQPFVYEIVLNDDIASITIEDTPLNIAINNNMAPQISITGSAPDPNYPNSLSLEYQLRDDTGFRDLTGRFYIKTPDGEVRAPSLEGTRTGEEFILPYE